MTTITDEAAEQLLDTPVPADVIPPGGLPPMTYRNLPDVVPLRRMIGPSIILAGLALGSGEFILWPYITYKTGFVFFFACVLGVVTQYFINMEISRWSLVTGESAITGFVRLSKQWAWVFLILNVVPWMIPAWARGAAQLLSWLIWGPVVNEAGQVVGSAYDIPLAIGGMVLCGIILTAGPVIYETIEKIQLVLVSLVLLLVVILAVWLLSGRLDAVSAQLTATVTLGLPDSLTVFDADTRLLDDVLTPAALLGALAFAGAGGTTNLGQSNYIKDKGYGMGHYVGRITSPITGQEEAITEVGYHFPPNPSNMARWRRWWRAASTEHFLSFFLTCLVCLVLLTLISYALYYDADGQLGAEAGRYKNDIYFVWGQAEQLRTLIGGPAKLLFLVMGIAILLTTEFGVLDAATRISTDVVKVAWLRTNDKWPEGRLYYLFLWSTIALGSGILLLEYATGMKVGSFGLFKLTAAMNGGVMFLYCFILLYMNRFRLPASVRMSNWRVAVMVWAVVFFGFFTCWAGYDGLRQLLK